MIIDTNTPLTVPVWRAALADMPQQSYDNLRAAIVDIAIAELGDAEQSGPTAADELADYAADLTAGKTVPVPVDALQRYRADVAAYSARLDEFAAELEQQGFAVDRPGPLTVTIKAPAP